MKRRRFVAMIGGALAAPFAIAQQPAKVPRIGLVASLARPGGNVSGLSLLTPELSGKRLELLAEVARHVRRAAVLNNPDNSSHTVFLEETLGAARVMQIQIHALNARDPGEIGRAFQEAGKESAQALIVFDDPVLWGHRKQVVALAAKARLPVMYGYSEFVDDGGLMSYGPHRLDLYRRPRTRLGSPCRNRCACAPTG